MKKIMLAGILLLCLAMTISGAMAAPGGNFSDSCYSESHIDYGDLSLNLRITHSCNASARYVEWSSVNLTALGDIVDGEVIIGGEWMLVDSIMRPDLDAPATLVWTSSPFAVVPNILDDGTTCSACNVSIVGARLEVQVPGFSNYSLTAKQEFTVYLDEQPELKGKVYQMIDLGNSRRGEEYACIVQIFGRSDATGAWVLVQTNPERKVQARILGNPDVNQPESLGYFPTVKGMANVYFRNDNIVGYSDFQYVAQCSNNATALIYEEPISTRYSPAGRTLVARGVWLTDGVNNESSNAFYVMVWIIGGIFVIWFGGMVVKSFRS